MYPICTIYICIYTVIQEYMIKIVGELSLHLFLVLLTAVTLTHLAAQADPSLTGGLVPVDGGGSSTGEL